MHDLVIRDARLRRGVDEPLRCDVRDIGITDGLVRRGGQCRLVRDGTVVYDGRIGSLRRFKDDVREVTAGMECGIVLENYPDVKEGDVIEVYETKKVEQTLA